MAMESKIILLSLMSTLINVESQYNVGYGMPMMPFGNIYANPMMNYYNYPSPINTSNNTNSSQTIEPENSTSCSCYCDTCTGPNYCCSMMCYNCYGVPADDENATESSTPPTEPNTEEPAVTTQTPTSSTCPPLEPCPWELPQPPLARERAVPKLTKQSKSKLNLAKMHKTDRTKDKTDDDIKIEQPKWIPQFGVITLPENIAGRLAQDLHALIQSQLAEQRSKNRHYHIAETKYPDIQDRPIVPVLRIEKQPRKKNELQQFDYQKSYIQRFRVPHYFTERPYYDPIVEDLIQSLKHGKKIQF